MLTLQTEPESDNPAKNPTLAHEIGGQLLPPATDIDSATTAAIAM